MTTTAKSTASCKGPGLVVPVIDRNRCEGKADCLRVCPHDVFRIGVIGDDEKRTMSFLGKLKARAHGNRQAFVDTPDACENCGACVTACPEKAIKLVPRAARL